MTVNCVVTSLLQRYVHICTDKFSSEPGSAASTLPLLAHRGPEAADWSKQSVRAVPMLRRQQRQPTQVRDIRPS